MAKTKNSPAPSVTPPAGMTKRSAAGNAPWLRKYAGAIIAGRVIGRFPRLSSKDQWFYQVLLSAEAETVGKGGVVETAEPGTLVNMDEVGDLKSLDAAAKAGEPYFWVHFTGKEKQKRDPSKTYWAMEVYTGSGEISA